MDFTAGQFPTLNFNVTPQIGRTTVPSFAEICRSAETSARRPVIDSSFLFIVR